MSKKITTLNKILNKVSVIRLATAKDVEKTFYVSLDNIKVGDTVVVDSKKIKEVKWTKTLKD